MVVARRKGRRGIKETLVEESNRCVWWGSGVLHVLVGSRRAKGTVQGNIVHGNIAHRCDSSRS